MHVVTSERVPDLAAAELPPLPKAHGIGAVSYQELLIAVLSNFRTHPTLRGRMREELRWERFLLNDEPPPNRDMQELGHALNTVAIAKFVAREALAAGRISPEDRAALLLAALVHDLGELDKGDVTYEQRSSDIAEGERKYFHTHVSELFPKISNAGQRALISLYDRVAMRKDGEDPLAALFGMVECLGYVTTALDEHERRSPQVDYLALCANVAKNMGPHIERLVQQDPIALRYFIPHLCRLESLFSTLAKNERAVSDPVNIELWANTINAVRRCAKI